jgi:hypothetical protein
MMSRNRSLVEKFKRIDMFSQDVNMRFAGRDTKYRTRMGAFCTLGMLVLVLGALVASLIMMLTKR